MKALVTGANGLIGANLARALMRAGYEVRALVRPESDVRSLQRLAVEIVYGDVLHADSLSKAARGCHLLFHAAALFSYWGVSAGELEHIAVKGTTHVIEAASQARVPRVVFTSSSVVFGSSNRPLVRNEKHRLDDQETAPYVLAKASQERAAFEHADRLGVELIAACPTLSVGPYGYRLGPSNGLIVSYLADHFKATYPGGCNLVSVQDVAEGHLLVAEKGRPGERYLLGSENLKWSDIHRMISELCGVPGPNWEANHTVSLLAATAAEFVSKLTRKPPWATREEARMVGRYYWYEHQKAGALGYQPRPARQALAEAIAWLSAKSLISRRIRSDLRFSRDVFEARDALEKEEARIGGSL
jgi:dihydroflavonol-4-reductase